ncbi:RUN and FYVE domain-containing protein 2-like [Sorex fumeus]|uniref:RUN and FYVE domain-containing protein 2-like n=1 Tax=Sorex fumeus TaxID=62283 RepID=UPI0024AC82D3|nr:RUN and FYVE domain-containing protein 2-like [Sorex fumeus]
MDGKQRIQEENVKLKKPLEESHRLQSHPEDEQDEPVSSEKPQTCQLCQDKGHLTQNVCKNCKGTFCDACSTNELPLPSSIKPERVCNPCHKHLMEQYSTSPA